MALPFTRLIAGVRGVPRRRGGVRRAVFALAALALAPRLAHSQPIDVRVEKRGDHVVVDVEATVAAEPHHAWAVLTDYDNMARFLTALKSSAIVARHGDSMQVEQTGEVRHGFLHFSFYSLRAVDIVPGKEIRSRLIKGDFKSYEFTTQLSTRGGHTVISHHGDYVPTTWVPPGIGPAMIRSETSRQYTELIAEMMRRQGGTLAPAAPGIAASQPG